MTDTSTIEGGCLCGNIRYRITGQPKDATHCHCTTCRKASGAAFVTWSSIHRDNFKWLGEKPMNYRASEIAYRGFCAHCGTHLTFCYNNRPDWIAFTAASLDDPSAITPGAHIWTKSRLPWLKLDDHLPEFKEDNE